MKSLASALKVLADGGVEFILIGGAAAIVHGSARVTEDIDVVYARSPANIERLVNALAAHHPYLRGVPAGLPFQFDADTVRRGLNFTLVTDLGDVDLLGEAAGGGTYEALRAHAVTLEAFGARFLCVTLRKLIELKRAAGRPKDLLALAELESLLEEETK